MEMPTTLGRVAAACVAAAALAVACGEEVASPAGGEAEGAGGFDTARCAEAETMCAAGCVDVTRDPANCGDCGRACEVGATCAGGTCALACDGGVVCGGACVDVETDPANCGTCGFACSTGQACSAGACALACPPGQVACNGACTDVSQDPTNCGACGTGCAAGEVCAAGACSLVCGGGTTKCGVVCVDTSKDPQNCGACGASCPAGTACEAGACELVCGGGTTKCGATCADLAHDPANCGACGKTCGGGQVCSAGACELVCGAGTTKCGAACVDTSKDPQNCGACGKACPAGQACAGGACKPPEAWWASGVQTDVPLAKLVGWTACWQGLYSAGGASIAALLASCSKPKLLLGCRPTGAASLTVLAMAPRVDAIFETGTGNVPHVANGVGWYYSASFSWGFAPEGASVVRNQCDTVGSSFDGYAGPHKEARLCWHTLAGNMNAGWRCGATDNLNGGSTWERVVYHAD